MTAATRFTGERPHWGEGYDYDEARHLAAYRFAAAKAAGLRVVDAGCGEGWGTVSLAENATSVLGLDYSADAVAFCRQRWGSSHVEFRQADLTREPSEGESGDLVCNFQVIEHIQDPLPFLEGLRARIAPGGCLVLTTPNRLRSVSENPYHVREYTAPELAELLGGVFGSVEILGMHGNDKVEAFESARAASVARILRLDPLGIRNMLPRGLVLWAFAKLSAVVRRSARQSTSQEKLTPSDFHVDAAEVDRALDLVAICRP